MSRKQQTLLEKVFQVTQHFYIYISFAIYLNNKYLLFVNSIKYNTKARQPVQGQ